MEKVTKIIDFIWILFYFLKITISKVFFIPQKNPDLYIADRQGFFYNQSDTRYAPPGVLWDVCKALRVFKLLLGEKFVSLYLRGGIPAASFNKKISDIDLIVFVKNPNHLSTILFYLEENFKIVLPNYSKVDILFLDIKDYEQDKISLKTKILLNMQASYVSGVKLSWENKIKFNDRELWSFFSSAISENGQKQSFVNKINSINDFKLKSERLVIQQITKCIIRGLYEQIAENKRIYTKNILHIKNLVKKECNKKTEKKHDILNLISYFENSVTKDEGYEELKNLLLKSLNHF